VDLSNFQAKLNSFFVCALLISYNILKYTVALPCMLLVLQVVLLESTRVSIPKQGLCASMSLRKDYLMYLFFVDKYKAVLSFTEDILTISFFIF